MRRCGTGLLLAVVPLLLAGCGGRDHITVEERLVLTLRHDPRPVLPAGPEAELTFEVEGNVTPRPGSVRLWWYAAGDTGWAAVSAHPGTDDRWQADVPAGRAGERAVYFLEASTPSGRRLHLPADLLDDQRPYETIRAGGHPGILRFLTLLGFAGGALFLMAAAYLGLRSLQAQGEPRPVEQTRVARYTAAGTGLLVAAALVGMIASMFIWGVPYRGFPLGGYVPHTKVLLLLLVWGGLTWASWGTLSRSPGSRDLVPPRLHAMLVVGAVLLSVLIVLLPAGGGDLTVPPLPIAG